jgi:hypothetical protein
VAADEEEINCEEITIIDGSQEVGGEWQAMIRWNCQQSLLLA